MRAPQAWWRPGGGLAAGLLWPVSRIWGNVAAWRMAKPARYRAPVPVICVGNPTVGGAGKTPTAIALARIARGRGLKPGLLSRGYGGKLAGPVLVDRERHTARDVGDEALLLAAAAPTVIARDRAAGARLLAAQDVDIIIMDDGFQNPALAFDLALLTVDAERGVGNGRVLPAGPLRAPLAPQLRRADALLVVGAGDTAAPLVRAAARAGRSTIHARLRPTRVRDWRKEPILAFAGIGHPDKFFATLTAAGAPVSKTLGFPDHHPYSEIDAEKLLRLADSEKLRLVTTEKDMARLSGATGARARLRERAEAFHVIMEFENPLAIGEMIDAAVQKAALAQSRQTEPVSR